MRARSSRPGRPPWVSGAVCSARAFRTGYGCRQRRKPWSRRCRKDGAGMPDVVTIGETMLRLSAPPGVPLEQAPQLDVHVAGAESNVAIALCRLGTTAGWISRLVDTPLGRRIVNELRGHGVDVSRVLWAPGGRIGIYFLEQGIPPRQHRIIYDRAQSAMSLLGPKEVDWGFVRSARLVHLTGITPALSAGCRAATVQAIAEARGPRALE